MNASSSVEPTQTAFSGPLDLLQGAPGILLQKAYFPANTSPAISAAASSCIAGMACE